VLLSDKRENFYPNWLGKIKNFHWKKYFQSSWTNDTIDGGIDEGVFAASTK
jgi:hypothetical protein